MSFRPEAIQGVDSTATVDYRLARQALVNEPQPVDKPTERLFGNLCPTPAGPREDGPFDTAAGRRFVTPRGGFRIPPN